MQQAPSYPWDSIQPVHEFIDSYIGGTPEANKQIIMDPAEEKQYAQNSLLYSLCQASLVHYGSGRVMDVHVPCCPAMCVWSGTLLKLQLIDVHVCIYAV